MRLARSDATALVQACPRPRRLYHLPLEHAFADDSVEEFGGGFAIPGAFRSILDLCAGAAAASETPHLAAGLCMRQAEGLPVALVLAVLRGESP